MNRTTFEMAFRLGARVNSSFNRSFNRAARNMSNLTDAIKTTAGAYLTLQGAQKTLDLTVGSAKNLESYRNTLNVVMKDHEKAAKKMSWATEFANKTPFDTASVIDATVKLESYQLTAEKVLPAIGNMAAIMGKDLDQGVEAYADAQRGELERLKEFGITKANILDHANKVMKYKNIINKKGQIIDEEKFNAALFSLMNERFAKGMEIQSRTAEGLESTILGASKLGFAKIAGISDTGEIVDGSMFDLYKEKAELAVAVINRMGETGTFEKIGQELSKIIKYSGKVLSIGTKLVQYLNRMRIDAIKKVSEVIKNSQPQIERIKNALGGIGAVLMRVFSAALPYIEKFAINLLPIGVQSLLIFGDVLAGIYNFVSKNWATIEPILVGIVSGFLAFKVITKVQRMVQGALLAIRLIGSSIPAVLGAIMSPIGIAVLAFAAIGIAVYQIIKHWDTLKAWFTGFKNFVLALFGGIGQYIDNSITGFVNKVISVLGFFRDILSGISNFISGKWGKIKSVFTGIISSLAGFKIITKIQSMAVGALLAIKAIGAGIAIVLLAVMSPIGLAVIAIGAIGTIVYKIIKHWDVLKAWFKSFKDYILDLFSSAYSGIASIFSGIGAVFTGIFEGVLSSFKGYINAWVMLFNFVIKSLNNIKINIPDWVPEVGGKSFGVNIPEVPMLAQGGITTGPTLAMIGEGREQEAVLPLSKLDRLLQKPKEKPKENAGMSFTYAPNIKVSGGMESHDIRELLKEDYLEFRKMVLKVLKDYKAEENRLRFA